MLFSTLDFVGVCFGCLFVKSVVLVCFIFEEFI